MMFEPLLRAWYYAGVGGVWGPTIGSSSLAQQSSDCTRRPRRASPGLLQFPPHLDLPTLV